MLSFHGYTYYTSRALDLELNFSTPPNNATFEVRNRGYVIDSVSKFFLLPLSNRSISSIILYYYSVQDLFKFEALVVKILTALHQFSYEIFLYKYNFFFDTGSLLKYIENSWPQNWKQTHHQIAAISDGLGTRNQSEKWIEPKLNIDLHHFRLIFFLTYLMNFSKFC